MKRNSPRAWLLAARPKTLSAAVLPVVCATGLAWADEQLRPLPALLCMLFALLMQVAANFINDLYDYRRGTDGPDRLGPKRACAQGWITPRAMGWGIACSLVAACGVGLAVALTSLATLTPLPAQVALLLLVAVGAACVLFAFLYSSLLSYCALGDVLVWLFFGLVPVVGTYFVQAGCLTPPLWLLAAGCGLATDTLLVLNNYRDRDTDRRAGKRTLVSVMGERAGSLLYLVQGLLAYLCAALTAMWGYTWMAVLPLFYLLPHYLTWHKMVQINHGLGLNRILGFTSRNLLTYALLCLLALAAHRWELAL